MEKKTFTSFLIHFRNEKEALYALLEACKKNADEEFKKKETTFSIYETFKCFTDVQEVTDNDLRRVLCSLYENSKINMDVNQVLNKINAYDLPDEEFTAKEKEIKSSFSDQKKKEIDELVQITKNDSFIIPLFPADDSEMEHILLQLPADNVIYRYGV